MPRAARRPAAFAAALAVVVFGVAYVTHRPERWSSTASVVLVPANEEDRASIIESYARSGTAGTFVEYLSGPGIRARAGVADGELAVRVVPDTRVIDLTFTADRPERASRGLDAIVAAGLAGQRELEDPWSMRVLASASAGDRAGASTQLVAAATALVAALAALAVWVIPGRREEPPSEAQLAPVAEDDRRRAA